MSVVDCDDGPGEVSRSKACIKKLVGQDKIFSLLTYSSWASASVHDDLKQYKLPAVGTWAYSQTEWQDPYMFPTHMSMIHEAMAGANWAKNVIKPKTYGLICLTSPEMQLACNEVQKIMDASGSKLVKKADVSISETSMSSQVLSMRAANPEHVIHYVINPATMAKFMVESAQQNYYPPKGISGNHLAAEVLGSMFGKHPIGRYWTNTTYKLWGPEFMATMNKYARGNRGTQPPHRSGRLRRCERVRAGRQGRRPEPDPRASDGAARQRRRLLLRRLAGPALLLAPVRALRHQLEQGMGPGSRVHVQVHVHEHRLEPRRLSVRASQPDPDEFVIYTWK